LKLLKGGPFERKGPAGKRPPLLPDRKPILAKKKRISYRDFGK
jgi:hypothetical protein